MIRQHFEIVSSAAAAATLPGMDAVALSAMAAALSAVAAALSAVAAALSAVAAVLGASDCSRCSEPVIAVAVLPADHSVPSESRQCKRAVTAATRSELDSVALPGPEPRAGHVADLIVT